LEKIALVSLGCAKNLVDSENMLALLKQANFEITNNPEQAEIIIINTCGFINSAKEESINTILEMAQYKTEGNCFLLVVAGCLVQKYQKELLEEIPEIDAFLGTSNFHEIVETVQDLLKKKGKVIKINKELTANYYELPRLQTTPPHYAYIRIAEGCDNCCTFCVIPQLRGGYRSRTIENIIQEARNLVAQGIKEIILIAQDTTQYGKDIYGEKALVKLLKELVKIPALRWIRLLYCYPNDFSEELIQLIKSEKKICKYLDIPLQHADDTILRKMGRRITRKEIEILVNKLKNEIPDIVLRSTFIVGFPGETEENFNTLLNFLEKMQLDRVGAFTYSREEDTPAGKLPGQISEKIKEARLEKLMKLQYEIIRRKNQEYLNKEMIVQVDGPSEDDPNLWLCRSEGEAPEIDPYILVHSCKNFQPGQLLLVRISHIQDYDFIGEVVRELT